MSARPRFVSLLSTAHRRVQQWIARRPSDGADVGPAQVAVLFTLEKDDGLLMGELATRLENAPSAISGLVDRMEAAGLVQRRPSDTDRRALRVFITPAGRALMPMVRMHLQELNRRLTQGFTSAELAVVERWLNHVRTAFDD